MDETAQAASPQAVIQALAKQRGKTAVTAERRRQARHAWDVNLTLDIEENLSQAVSRRTINVVTTDLSTGGFAFLHRQYIHPGSVIRARFDALPRRPVLAGVVRSCIKTQGIDHRIGVEFVLHHPNPGKTRSGTG